MSVYRIKPLEWRQIRDASHEDGEWWTADAIFGNFDVDRYEYGAFQWRYCIDEFYDEGSHGCTSIAEGKAEAERFYLSRLLPALEEVQ